MIGGLTLGNEGSVRDWLRHGTLNVTQGKNFDKSGSLGPWIVTGGRGRSGQAAARHDAGQRRAAPGRHHRPADLGLRLADQLHLAPSRRSKPGDLIWTGTPTGAGGHRNPPVWLKPGDVVEVEVPEIGVLRNTVVDEV